MANEYYDHGTYPAPNTKITSAGMRAELDNVEFGFDKLPPLTGNGGKKVKVKADETGLEAVVDAQTAAGTSFAATGGISATNVQDAIAELDTEKADIGHSHAASAVSFTPAGGIAASNVQAAIAELDTEKAASGHTHTGTYQPASANLDTLALVTPTTPGTDLLSAFDTEEQRTFLGLGSDATGSNLSALTDPGTARFNLGVALSSGQYRNAAFTAFSSFSGYIYLCDGTFTVTVPAPAALGVGFIFSVAAYETNTGPITVNHGAASPTYVQPGTMVTFYCDGLQIIPERGYDANAVMKNVANVFTAQQTPFNGSLMDGATINWNGNTNGQVVSVTLAGNRTMAAPTNIVQNTMYLMRVSQDATGSRTLTWNAAYKFGTAGAPTLTTAASKTDWLSFVGGAGNTLEYLGARLDAV
jgi:hypothetical protein